MKFKNSKNFLINCNELKTFVLILFIALFSVCFVILIGGCIYDTSDDLFMHSVTEGKLWAFYPSNLLVFSNAFWGSVLLNLPIPDNFFLDRYSTGLISCIVWAACLMINCILKSEKNIYIKLFILLIIFVPLIIRPQYTITAGLLTIAGTMWLRVYWFEKRFYFTNIFIPVISFLLAYLLRDKMFFVVFIIGLPTWFSFKYLKSIQFYAFSVILILPIIILNLYNKNAYNSELQIKSLEKRKILEPFFDYHFGKKLLKKSNADLLERSKLSQNDINLMEDHFYDFPEINDNLQNLGEIQKYYFANRDYISSRLQNARINLKHLLNPRFILLVIGILLLPFIVPEKDIWRLTMTIYLGLIFFIALGYLQRAGQPRVYFPMLLAIFLPWLSMFNSTSTKTLAFWIKSMVVFLFVIHCFNEIQLHRERVKESKVLISDFKKLKINDFVVWGGINIELIHPVFPQSEFSNHLYRSVGFTDKGLNANFGMVEGSVTKNLLSGVQLYFLTSENKLELLKNYFKEKYNKLLNFKKVPSTGHLNLFIVDLK